MTDRLIDNTPQRRLSDAVNAIAPHSSQARFATGYFFLSGFQPIADSLRGLEHVKLLIGTTTNRATVEQLALGFRRREIVEEKLREQRFVNVERALNDTVRAIRQEISELQPGSPQAQTIKTLADLIESGRIDVRVYTRGVLHAKAYIFDYKTPLPNAKGVAIVGSSNLTEPGLTSNTELNVQVDDNADVISGEGLHKELCEWFDALWEEAKPFSAELMRELKESWAVALASPYDVYLKMLFEMVRNKVEDDPTKIILPDEIPLAAYQRVAVQQAIAIVNTYGGGFVADVVGVGKSFVGAAVARHFYEAERRRPLIVCPKPLEKMWQEYNRTWHLNAEVVAVSLLTEPKPGENGTEPGILDQDRFQDCRFVLIDESHNFRYADSQRYRVLSDFLLEGRDRKALLLSATPYNKTPWDVFNQIRLFHADETTRVPVEPRNLRQYFRRVENGQRKLQDLLMHLLVRRTRWQLLRWYGYDSKTEKAVNPHDFAAYLNGDKRAYLKFTDVAGQESKMFFPNRELETIEYCVDDVYGEQHGKSLYEELVRLLHKRKGKQDDDDDDDHDDEPSDPRALIYARYGLWNYVLPKAKQDQQYRKLIRAGRNLRGLIRTSLLKRLESSVASFRKSIDRQVLVHRNFLAALDAGKIAAGHRAADLLEQQDWDESEELLASFMSALEEADVERGFGYDITDFDVAKLREEVAHDLETFELIQGMVDGAKIPPASDAKLQELLKRLPKLTKKGKLLIFSEFRDTAQYIFENLPESMEGKVAIASGEVEVTPIVNRFAPKANKYQLKKGEHELLTVVSTDVLAEGLNLQDANQVLNYDLHWNPVRLIQRFGRIDRIGSQHDVIYALNFLPEKKAEEQLDLRQKLSNRIREFNEILGSDAKILDDKDKVNPDAVYAIYEERSGKHLGRFEGEQDLVGLTLAHAEEFFRELKEQDPDEYERIKNLRDGIRTARNTGAKKVLVLCRSGEFLRLYVRDLADTYVDIDTVDALELLRCEPDEKVGSIPDNLNDILTTVKLNLLNEVDELGSSTRQGLR